MHLLGGVIRHYAWGATNVIAGIQGRPPSGEPEAELWLGAHPSAPSALIGEARTLDQLISAEPATLGPAAADFDGFPFLLKILAAAEPLSIQAHPTLEQARLGFGRETAAGVPLDSPRRTYRDANHKPELLCALTPFEAKCGFRVLADTGRLIGHLAGLGEAAPLVELARHLRAEGRSDADTIRATLTWLVGLDDTARSGLVAALVEASEATLAAGVPAGLAVFEPDLRWTAELHRFHPADIGVVVALLLNHVVLEPGQAVFLSAGNLHAYLRGAGVELMANSDNVVRGGLTVKHVDVDELLAVVDPGPGPAPVQTAASGRHRFDSPVPEFSLTRFTASGPGLDERVEPRGPEIVLVTDGGAIIGPEGSEAGDDAATLTLEPGDAAFIGWNDGPYRLRSTGAATVWRATVGDMG